MRKPQNTLIAAVLAFIICIFPMQALAQPPTFTVSPQSLDFGTVEVNQSATISIALTNVDVGSQDLHGATMLALLSQFAWYDAIAFPFDFSVTAPGIGTVLFKKTEVLFTTGVIDTTLTGFFGFPLVSVAPSQSLTLVCTITPRLDGVWADTLEIYQSGPVDPLLPVTVTAVLPPPPYVIPNVSAMDFGVVTLGGSSSASFTLDYVGALGESVVGIGITTVNNLVEMQGNLPVFRTFQLQTNPPQQSPWSVPGFGVLQFPAAPPVVQYAWALQQLVAGQTISINLTLKPLAIGVTSGVVHIFSTGDDTEIPFMITALAPPPPPPLPSAGFFTDTPGRDGTEILVPAYFIWNDTTYPDLATISWQIAGAAFGTGTSNMLRFPAEGDYPVTVSFMAEAKDKMMELFWKLQMEGASDVTVVQVGDKVRFTKTQTVHAFIPVDPPPPEPPPVYIPPPPEPRWQTSARTVSGTNVGGKAEMSVEQWRARWARHPASKLAMPQADAAVQVRSWGEIKAEVQE